MSDDPRDALAKNIFGDEAGTTRQMRQYAYEERVIKRVFAGSGITPRGGWGYFVNQSREMIGVPKLSFQWFNSTFQFPSILCGKRIPYMHELTLVDLIKPSHRHKIWKRVLGEVYKIDIDISRQKFAFCFPVVRTLFCAHNMRSQTAESWDKTDWRFQISMQADGNWLFVEPLATLCRGIPAAEWFDV